MMVRPIVGPDLLEGGQLLLDAIVFAHHSGVTEDIYFFSWCVDYGGDNVILYTRHDEEK